MLQLWECPDWDGKEDCQQTTFFLRDFGVKTT